MFSDYHLPVSNEITKVLERKEFLEISLEESLRHLKEMTTIANEWDEILDNKLRAYESEVKVSLDVPGKLLRTIESISQGRDYIRRRWDELILDKQIEISELEAELAFLSNSGSL